MDTYIYSDEELKQALVAFDSACASLFESHGSNENSSELEQQRRSCMDALLSALADLEVIQEVMRIQGNYPLNTIDIERLHLEALRRCGQLITKHVESRGS